MGVEAGDSEGQHEERGSGARGWESWGVRLECKLRGLSTFTILGPSWERRGEEGSESGFRRWAGVAWLVRGGHQRGGGQWEGAGFESEEAATRQASGGRAWWKGRGRARGLRAGARRGEMREGGRRNKVKGSGSGCQVSVRIEWRSAGERAEMSQKGVIDGGASRAVNGSK